MNSNSRAKRKPNRLDAPDTNNATLIGWDEIDSSEEWRADFHPSRKRDYYQYLDRMNAGLQNGPKWQNKRYETYNINRWLVLGLGSHLKMGNGLRKRAVSLFDGINRSTLGVRVAIPALVTCAYVIHKHDPRRECHPQTSESKFDPLVEAERITLDITKKQYASVYGKIEQRVRTGQLTPSRHDAYEVDTDGLQTWRELNPNRDDGWL